VNINTAFDGHSLDGTSNNRILEGVFKQFPNNTNGTNGLDTTTFRDNVLRTLRGPDAGTDFALNPNLPSVIANPVRATDLGSLMPNSTTPTVNMRQNLPVAATLMRPHPSGATVPLFAGTSTLAHESPTRNPYFAYQPLQYVWNKVTTQSNCYAIWITVGYFEVESTGVPNYVYPDGYRLGAEMGADSGEIKRHRAFYIVDRSIPVGFEPGEDHNVDKCVLLRRIIE
jgi:hypothetical protein